MFYDIIHNLGFSYVDELCALLLLILFLYRVFRSNTWEFNRLFLITIAVFLFYLVYSFYINSNTKAAILTDFLIQIKPYMAFFCVYALNPQLSDNQKKIIRQTVILCSIYVIFVGVGWHIDYGLVEYTFGHPSRIATASTVMAFLYIYCSDYSRNDKLVFLFLLAIGLLSGRSKHYGLFAACALMIMYFKNVNSMRWSAKNISFSIIALVAIFAVSYEKIYSYFILGGFGDGREASDLYARIALYYFSTFIIMDYIPFGCGFGSYATFASAEYYSPVYAKYGMDSMHGLSKSYPDFIADTYYPVLAQFGFVGVALFFAFWTYLTVRAIKAFNSGIQKEALIALMVILFFLIECTSDSTITHNRGMFMMMILGLLISRPKEESTLEKI
jgi:hypothetical protein